MLCKLTVLAEKLTWSSSVNDDLALYMFNQSLPDTVESYCDDLRTVVLQTDH